MTARTADPRIVPLFIERWSPRAYDGTPIPPEDLNVIFEAAGWAPSAFNYQPWRFLYAVHGDANWDRFLSLLIPFNAGWAKSAGALVFVVSDTLMRSAKGDQPNHSHSFDAGAAWALLALQATALGYHAHGMTGVDFAKAQAELGVPDDFRIEAAVAIGLQGNVDSLPEPLRAREAPSGRHPATQLAVAGTFGDLPAT